MLQACGWAAGVCVKQMQHDMHGNVESMKGEMGWTWSLQTGVECASATADAYRALMAVDAHSTWPRKGRHARAAGECSSTHFGRTHDRALLLLVIQPPPAHVGRRRLPQSTTEDAFHAVALSLLLSHSSPSLRLWTVMHLWGYGPLVAFIPLALTAQVTFNQDATALSKNIIDALSEDPDYTSLLGLLQRAKLIPTLNKLNSTTLFAPTNDAIKRHASVNLLWQTALADGAAELRDNIQEKLRQELFYHMLNYTLEEFPKEQDPEVLLTLHYPRIPVEPPSHEPPPSPPWMPEPGGTLGGKPQRLRIASRDETSWVGVNAFGEDGAKVSKVVDASNGKVVGIDAVLSVPQDLGQFIATIAKELNH